MQEGRAEGLEGGSSFALPHLKAPGVCVRTAHPRKLICEYVVEGGWGGRGTGALSSASSAPRQLPRIR